MTTAYLTHPSSLKHDMGAGHPECPARIHAIEDQLIASGLMPFLFQHEAPAVTTEQLERVHSRDYIESIFKQSPRNGLVYLDADTAMNPHSLEAALHAAGAAVKAVDLVMGGQAENAFCNIRPPGHHAGRSSAAGFCIFNNVAVAAAHALEQHGLQRVAIADFDVHHGNGTDEIFNADSRVMLCSTFATRIILTGARRAPMNISSTCRLLEVQAARIFARQSPKNGCRRWKIFNRNWYWSRQASMHI